MTMIESLSMALTSHYRALIYTEADKPSGNKMIMMMMTMMILIMMVMIMMMMMMMTERIAVTLFPILHPK